MEKRQIKFTQRNNPVKKPGNVVYSWENEPQGTVFEPFLSFFSLMNLKGRIPLCMVSTTYILYLCWFVRKSIVLSTEVSCSIYLIKKCHHDIGWHQRCFFPRSQGTIGPSERADWQKYWCYQKHLWQRRIQKKMTRSAKVLGAPIGWVGAPRCEAAILPQEEMHSQWRRGLQAMYTGTFG